MSPVECPTCHGRRLRPASLAVRVKNFSIAEFTALSLARALMTVRNWEFADREMQIAGRVLDEIRRRLEFLSAVGLDYLSLERSAATLSGRRSAAHPAGHADRLEAAGRAVRAGRAFDRAAPARQRPAAGNPGAPARHGQHGAGGGARCGDHRARRLRDRPWAGRGAAGRRPGGGGRSRRDRPQSRIAHRPVSIGSAGDRRFRASAASRATRNW